MRRIFSGTSRRFIGYLACLAVVGMFPFSSAFAEGDAAKGEKIFKRCSACHKIGPEAKNAVGPVLTGVVGRTAGTLEGFKYGKSTKAAGEKGLIWTEEMLFDYLANPKKFLRAYLDDKKAKSKMVFKLKKEDQRRDVIAYLKTFSD